MENENSKLLQYLNKNLCHLKSDSLKSWYYLSEFIIDYLCSEPKHQNIIELIKIIIGPLNKISSICYHPTFLLELFEKYYDIDKDYITCKDTVRTIKVIGETVVFFDEHEILNSSSSLLISWIEHTKSSLNLKKCDLDQLKIDASHIQNCLIKSMTSNDGFWEIDLFLQGEFSLMVDIAKRWELSLPRSFQYFLPEKEHAILKNLFNS